MIILNIVFLDDIFFYNKQNPSGVTENDEDAIGCCDVQIVTEL